MAPGLLAVLQVQCLQCLLHPLIAGEVGSFVVSGGGTHSRQFQIGAGLWSQSAERFIGPLWPEFNRGHSSIVAVAQSPALSAC